MAKQLTINEEACLGCEACVELCPEVFALDNLGKAYVRDEDGGSEKCVEEAMAACPARCIAYENPPEDRFIFYERPNTLTWITGCFIPVIFIIHIGLHISSWDIDIHRGADLFAFSMMVLFLFFLVWGWVQPLCFPLLTLSQEGLFCHDMHKEIPWSAIKVKGWHLTWIKYSFRSPPLLQLTLSLDRKRYILPPASRGRMKVKGSKLTFVFQRLPKNMDKEQLYALLERYKTKYGTLPDGEAEA